MNAAKRRVYLTAFLIAVLGLVLDRFMIGVPRESAAGLALDPDDIEAGPESYVRLRHLALQVVFPESFPEVDWSRRPRDPFDLPPDIAARRDQRLAGGRVTETPRRVRGPGEAPRMAEFLRKHQLNGVFVGDGARAIIDGVILEVGKSHDGAELIEVRGNRAAFRCADGVAVLKVDGSD